MQSVTTVLAGDEEDDITVENQIIDEINKTGKQTNVSMVAFTATPKGDTLQLFGTLNSEGKKAYITKEFARRIGTKEEEAFFVGDGSGKPTGIFNATGGAEVGVTAASATAITADELIDLFHSLKAPY